MINVNSQILYKKFDNHLDIKDELLNLINKQQSESLKPGQYADNVSRLDWSSSNNFERPWVKFFMPHFIRNYNKLCLSMNRKSFQVKDIWFQQYEKDGTHGWHTHSENYTGVYYLEMPSGPQTQIYDGKIINLPVEEGDIIIFPSFLIHRAPVIKDESRKTIISFNVNFEGIKNELLEVIDEME